MAINMANEHLTLDKILENKKDTFSLIKIEKQCFEDPQTTNMDDIKNDYKEIHAHKTKEEFFECEGIGQEFAGKEPAVHGSYKMISPDCSVKEELFGEILMKEEIKEENLEDQSSPPDENKESLDYQTESIAANVTDQRGIQNCIQEKIQCLSSKVETRLFLGSGNLQNNSCSVRNEQIGTLKAHETTHKAEIRLKCSYCPYHPVRIGDLKKHERTHTGERPFKCNSCYYRATEFGTLKRHERTHTGEKPFKSNSCSYQTAHKGGLKFHERTHTGERPFKCSFCPYRAARIGNLKNHVNTHTGERPFKCNLCSYQATERGSLKRHERTHTGEKPFKCSSCPYQAARIGNLKNHERTHTGERPFKCSTCPYQAARIGNLKNHERTHKQKNILNAASIN